MNDPKNKLGQYAGLEQLSTQALEDLLQQDFAAGEDHSNPDLVMAIMEVMEQRTPKPPRRWMWTPRGMPSAPGR